MLKEEELFLNNGAFSLQGVLLDFYDMRLFLIERG